MWPTWWLTCQRHYRSHRRITWCRWNCWQYTIRSKTWFENLKAALRRKGWACEKCTLVNQNSNEVCAACGEPRYRTVKPKQEETRDSLFMAKEDEWACVQCTYANPNSSSKCSMCNTKRPTAETPTSPEQEALWDCPRCTMLNSVEGRYCIMCQAERSSKADAEAASTKRRLRRTAQCDERE